MQLVRCRPKRRSLRLRRRTRMRSEQRFRSERPSCPGTFIRLQNFVQVLLGRLCFQGVSWLLLCTSKEVTRCPQDSGSFALASKEVTRCPQDSGSFALASKEVTRSACGRAEALLWSASNPRAGRERKTAGCASRTEQDHFRATLTRACGAASPASRTGDRQNFSVHQVFASALRTRSARGFRACDAAPPADRRTTIRRRDRRECRSAKRPG